MLFPVRMPPRTISSTCALVLQRMSGYVVEPAGRQDALLGAPLEARVADLIRALDEPFELNDPDHLDACHRLWEATWPGVAFGGVDHKGQP